MLAYTHTLRAHTDGDAFVVLPAGNVLHTGDLFWTGRYPVVDYGVGGSYAAMAAALERMDKVGHRPTDEDGRARGDLGVAVTADGRISDPRDGFRVRWFWY